MKRNALLLGLLLAGSQVWAAAVHWDYPRNISATNDMPQGATVISALNAGSGTAVTWEGVNFEADTGHGNATFYLDSANWYNGFVSGLPIPKISGAKKDIMTSANWDSYHIVISNLTVGEDYTIQIWSSDGRSGQKYREMTIDDGLGNTVTLRENVYRKEGSLGQYVLGTFTADRTYQVLNLSCNDANAIGLVNALVLYAGKVQFGDQPTDTTPGDSSETIEWDQYARPITGPDDEDLLNLPVFDALSVGGDRDITIGNVTFLPDIGTSSIIVMGEKTNSGMVPGPQGATDPVISQDYMDVLDSAATNAYGIVLTGLTRGTTYTVQIWVNDANASAGYNYTCIESGARSVRHNMQATTNSLGQYILGKFEAASDVQAISVGDGLIPNTAHINAIVVYKGDATFDPNPPSVLPKEPPSPWQGPKWIIDEGDLLTNQPVVKAINVGSSETNVVAGITFLPDDGAVSGPAYGDFTWSLDADWAEAHSNYAKLFKPARYSVTSINVTGLTPGQTYTIQIWSDDSRGGIGDNRGTVLTYSGASVTLAEASPTNNMLGQYALLVVTPESSSVNISVTGRDNPGDAVISAYAVYEGEPHSGPADKFAEWASSHGLSGADAEQGADPDGDGVDNLHEYAFGGDPTNSATAGTLPVLQLNGSADAQYIYNARTDDSQLTYQLEITDDLVAGNWTNAGFTSVTGAIDSTWNRITNSIPTDLPAKFIRLKIEHQ